MSAIVATEEQVDTFQAIVIKNALKLYAKTGMKVNAAYTPTRMMQAASRITGKKFRARDYGGAVAALALWIEENR